MNLERMLIVSEKNEILYLGSKLLTFMNRKLKEPIGYPPEKIEQYDKVLLFVRDCADLDNECKNLIEEQLGRIIPDQGTAIIVSKKDSYLYPLTFFSKRTDDKKNLIDTIYDHQELLVTQMENGISIEIDGQFLNIDVRYTNHIIIAFNESGIKYFCSGNSNSLKQNINPIITSEPFYGWYDMSRLRLMKNGLDFLERDFVDVLNSVSGYSEIVDYRNCQLEIQYDRIVIDNRLCNCYEINDKAQLCSNITSANKSYMSFCNNNLRNDKSESFTLNFSFLGNDSQIANLKRLIKKSCRTNMTILLTGESGTGKTTMAKNIHSSSKRKESPFIAVNCAAISYSLIESELFGYDEGSFTGARKGGKKGYFELADGGTLFLDEISEIPYNLQGKLLEVIQTGTFFRVGGEEKIHSDFRLIAATNRNLKDMVKARSFREDLYYRINVFPIELPPLCERVDSLPYIISDMLPGICNRLGIEPVLVSTQAMDKMKNYHWPGNIRELGNVLEKAAVLCDDNFILAEDIDISDNVRAYEHSVNLKEAKEHLEEKLILKALEKYHGEKIKTAKALGISRTGLFEKMKKYGIEMKEIGDENADE